MEAPAQDDLLFVSNIKSVLQQAQDLNKVCNGLRMNKILQQKQISKPFKVGDRVWVKSSALRDPTSADAGKKKLQPLFAGPFPITQVMGPATFKIELPPRIKGHKLNLPPDDSNSPEAFREATVVSDSRSPASDPAATSPTPTHPDFSGCVTG